MSDDTGGMMMNKMEKDDFFTIGFVQEKKETNENMVIMETKS